MLSSVLQYSHGLGHSSWSRDEPSWFSDPEITGSSAGVPMVAGLPPKLRAKMLAYRQASVEQEQGPVSQLVESCHLWGSALLFTLSRYIYRLCAENHIRLLGQLPEDLNVLLILSTLFCNDCFGYGTRRGQISYQRYDQVFGFRACQIPQIFNKIA